MLIHYEPAGYEVYFGKISLQEVKFIKPADIFYSTQSDTSAPKAIGVFAV